MTEETLKVAQANMNLTLGWLKTTCLIWILLVRFSRIRFLRVSEEIKQMAEKLPVILDNQNDNTVLESLQKLDVVVGLKNVTDTFDFFE